MATTQSSPAVRKIEEALRVVLELNVEAIRTREGLLRLCAQFGHIDAATALRYFQEGVITWPYFSTMMEQSEEEYQRAMNAAAVRILSDE